jgi:hypothetical protein
LYALKAVTAFLAQIFVKGHFVVWRGRLAREAGLILAKEVSNEQVSKVSKFQGFRVNTLKACATNSLESPKPQPKP